MGLDIVELMLEIEEQYAIEVDEDDAKDVRTFGDLVDMVKRSINKTPPMNAEQAGYEVVRDSLLAELRIWLPKDLNVDEHTKLKELKRHVKRRDIWSAIQERFPELPSWRLINMRRTWFVDAPMYLGFLGVIISCWFISTYLEEIVAWWMISTIMLGIGLAWLFLIVGRLPHRTIGDVAEEITQKRQTRCKAQQLSVETIEEELRTMLVEGFALKPEEIHRDSDLFKDLRLS